MVHTKWGILTELDLWKGFTFALHCFEKMAFSFSQVLDPTANSRPSVDALQATVDNAVAQLKKQGLLSGETVGQLFNSVSNKLNGQSDELQKADRQKVKAY